MGIVITVLLFIGLVFGWALWSAAKRRKAFEAVAAGMGWTYAAQEPGLTAPFQAFELFRSGREHVPANVLRGAFGGHPMTVFDYAYSVGSGKNRSTVQQTVVHIEDPALDLPTFAVRPENVAHKLFSALGYQDIDLAHRPAFSKACVLRGPDEAAIRARFTDPVIDLFEANRGLCVQGGGPHLIVLRERRLVKPEALPELLTAAADVHRAFHTTAVIPPPLPAAPAA
jgi:hypothetical protein